MSLAYKGNWERAGYEGVAGEGDGEGVEGVWR